MGTNLDIRNMRQLLAVRRHGSFAKAAEALGISQPSLSASILRLEDQLGVSLFERSAQGSRLTPIGELIAERAGKVVQEAEQIVREAALVAGGEAGALRIGVGSALRYNFLPGFVRALVDTYPLLGICFDVMDRDRLLLRLKARELDLVICAVGDELADDSLVVTEVLTTRGVAVARPGYPLVGEAGVTPARFAEFPAAGTALHQFTNAEILGVPGEESRLLRYQSNDYEPLIELALMGRATLVAPGFVVQPYLSDGRLAPIDLDWDYRISFAAVATRAAITSPVVSRAIRHAAAIGAQLAGDDKAAAVG